MASPLPEQQDPVRTGLDYSECPQALGTMCNTFAPINQLPVEILVEILLFVRVRSFWDEVHIDPIHYMRVCRRWRTVILDHACFWDTVTVSKNTKGLRRAFSRSQQAPLYLAFSDLPTLVRVLLSVVALGDRIRSLVLRPAPKNELPLISTLLESAFPVLTTLNIQAFNSRRDVAADSEQPVIMPTNYPQLAHLDLSHVHVQLTSSLLRNLTALHLKDCSISPSLLSGDTFLDILQCGQRLEELTLENFMSAACSDLPSRSRHPLVLPGLSTLDVTDTMEWIHAFRTCVPLPAGGTINLAAKLSRADVEIAPFRPWERLLPHRLHDMPFLRTAHGLTIFDNTRGCLVKWYYQGSSELTLQLLWPDHTSVGSAALLTSLTEALRPSTALSDMSLLLCLGLHDVPRVVLDAFLDALPGLDDLSLVSPVEGHDAVPAGILGSLASPRPAAFAADVEEPLAIATDRTSAPDSETIRCPQLRAVHIGGFSWCGGTIMDTVLACLRERERYGAPRLRTLTIKVKPRTAVEEGVDQGYAGQVRALVSRKYRFSVGSSCSENYI